MNDQFSEKKTKAIQIKNHIVLFGLMIISICITIIFAHQYHNAFKQTIINQWNQQLETTVQISSVNFESFMEKFSENIKHVAHDPLIQKKVCQGVPDKSEKGYCPLKDLYNIHNNEMDAILLVDSTGMILVRFPEMINKHSCIGKKCGRGVSNEKHLADDDFFISEVFLNHQSNPAIALSVPIIVNNKFSGLVRWMVSTNRISKKFVDHVKVGNKGYMWVTDNKNNIISHHNKDIIGANIKKFRLENNLNREFVNLVENNNEGVGQYIDFAHNELCLVVFKKINIGDFKWTLIVNLPYEEIVKPISSHALKTFILAGLISIIITITVFVLYRIQKRKTQLETESKYLANIAKSEEILRIERGKRLTAVIDGQEIERSRISRELHDGLGQLLLAVKVKLESITDLKSDYLNSILKEIKSQFIKTVDEIKRISDNLSPVVLSEFGISTALQNLCEDISNNNKIKIDFVSYGIIEEIDEKIKTYLYRIAQEALSNVVKHAQATEVNIQLLGNREQITLIVQDNGKGFDENSTKRSQGNGLNNIKERTAILRGVCEIKSSPGNGTIINITVQFDNNNDETS